MVLLTLDSHELKTPFGMLWMGNWCLISKAYHRYGILTSVQSPTLRMQYVSRCYSAQQSQYRIA